MERKFCSDRNPRSWSEFDLLKHFFSPYFFSSLQLQGFRSPTVTWIFSEINCLHQETSYLHLDLCFPALCFCDSFRRTSSLGEMFQISAEIKVRTGKHSTFSPLRPWKRQLSRDMRFLGGLIWSRRPGENPVWQPLWNRLRCKRGDGGLSSERMPGKTKWRRQK